MIDRAIQGEGCEQRALAVCSPKCQNSRLYPFLVCSDGLIHSFHRVFHRNCEKKPGCFPLFPLSFPHFPVRRFIHGVLYRADLCEDPGNYGPLHLFSERKSNPKIYFLQQAENPLVEFLPVGMKETVVFHTRFLQKSTCGKQRENLSFQQTSQSPTATAPPIGEPRSVLACPTRKQQRLPPLTEVLQLKKRPRPLAGCS